MTTLLFALDFFKETLFQNKVESIQLMFDETNQTNEEEILTEDNIEIVFLKPNSMADMLAASSITEK